MEEKKLRRSCDKMIAGVCAGLADYFGIAFDIPYRIHPAQADTGTPANDC